MSTVAWWHCFAGIAGDMALASLVDAGADLDRVVGELEKLPVEGWALGAEKVKRASLVGTHLKVELAPEADGRPRDWAAVRALLEAADGLPERARHRAIDVFAALAQAEAKLHGVPVEQVHFHEVGATDAVLDVVGTCVALELLGVDVVRSSPVTVGLGTVPTAHGVLPNPAPAVMQLLSGAPVRGVDEALELTTPTGAAILAALAESFGPAPPMRVHRTGYGAGSRDLPGTANVLQVVIGELAEPAGAAAAISGPTGLLARQPRGPFEGEASLQDLAVLEATVDDVSGEILADAVSAALSAGALDAWLVPVVGKKGRPAQVITVLADPALVPALAEQLAHQTGTLGLRSHNVARWALPRKVVTVDVEGLPVRVKVGPYRAKAEHDDCLAVAGRLGWSAAEVARRAEHLAAST